MPITTPELNRSVVDGEHLTKEYVDANIASWEASTQFDDEQGQAFKQAASEMNAVAVESGDTLNTSTVGAPEGFPSTAELGADENDPVGSSLGALSRRILGAPNRGVVKAYGFVFDRSLKKLARFNEMSAEQQIAHVEKTGRNITLFGATAIVAYGLSRVVPLDTFTFDNSKSSALPPLEPRKVNDQEVQLATRTVALDVDGRHEVSTADIQGILPNGNKDPHALSSFMYDFDSDPGRQASGKHGNDFGLTLESPATDKWPAGFSELIDKRWMDSPKEFATVMSKLGLVENNPDAINKLAEQMQAPGGEKLFQENYLKVREIMDRATVTEQPITGPYGSYYVVDKDGKLTIAYDSYVSKTDGNWGTMYVIEVDGKKVCLRRQCGGQPIDMLPKPVVRQLQPTQSYAYREQITTHQPQRPSTPSTPTNPETPDAPETPEVPEEPEVPTEPEQPYVKPPAPANEFVQPLDSGDRQDPYEVEEEVTAPVRSNIGIPHTPITDRFRDTTPTDRASGVRSPQEASGLNTQGDTDAGSAGTTANGSMSGDNI
jgi:hypothetical protein